MKLINKKVKHIVFGDGKVINQEEHRITVKFSEEFGTKLFVYPNVFGKYLKLYDADLETSVVQELLSNLAQIKDEKEEKQRRYEENRVSEKLKLDMEKKITTKKKNAAKKSKVNN